MRGEVIHYDDNQGVGYISGDDGERYGFARADMKQLVAIGRGTRVDFTRDGANARDIFVMAGAPSGFGRAPVVTDARDSDPGLFGYFKRGMTEKYATFRGRARRKEYWGFVLFATILMAVFAGAGLAIDAAMGNFDQSEAPYATMVLAGVLLLALFIPGLAVTIRRIHDLGLSGWFYLLVLVPYVGNLIIFVFTVMPTQKNENKWGPVPAGIT